MAEKIDITLDLLLTDLGGVEEVRIYRDNPIDEANLGTPLATVAAGTGTYTDTVDFGSTHEYMIENYSSTDGSTFSNIIKVFADEDIFFMSYSGNDYAVKTFNTRGNAVNKSTPAYNYARAMDVAPNGVFFLGGNYKPTRYDGNTMTWESDNKGAGGGNDYAVVYDTRGYVYFGGSGKYVRQHNAADGTLIKETQVSNNEQIKAMTLDLYGRIVVATGNYVKCFDSSLTEVWTFSQHTNNVNCVQAAKDGSYMSAGSDNRVFKFTEQTDGSLPVDWSADLNNTIYENSLSYNEKYGKVLAQTGNNIHLLDYATGTEEMKSSVPNYGSCFLSDTGLMYGFSYGNGIKRFNMSGDVVWEVTIDGNNNFSTITSTPGAQGIQLGIYNRATA